MDCEVVFGGKRAHAWSMCREGNAFGGVPGAFQGRSSEANMPADVARIAGDPTNN